MRVTDIFIVINEGDIAYSLNRFLNNKNIFISHIEINHGIFLKIKYKIFKNISIRFEVFKVADNKIYIEINKLLFKYLVIPKKVVELFLNFLPFNIKKEGKRGRFIVDLNDIVTRAKVNIKSISLKEGFIKIVLSDVCIKKEIKQVGIEKRRELFLKLTQTILRLSGDDIMSFVKDFIKTDKVIISGIDICNAIYIKGVIINCFEVGDISVNIKELKENLIYLQIKPIGNIISGINIEHIPIKVYVKDVIKYFDKWGLDLDLCSVKFIDEFIEVRINNFKMDIKNISSKSHL